MTTQEAFKALVQHPSVFLKVYADLKGGGIYTYEGLELAALLRTSGDYAGILQVAGYDWEILDVRSYQKLLLLLMNGARVQPTEDKATATVRSLLQQ